jgi:GAF domain-containing protein
MISKEVKPEVPAGLMESWQEIADILAGIVKTPVALIMRFTDPDIEVLVSSHSDGNPYHPGDKEKLYGSGLYCETVIKTKGKLHVPDALADSVWKDNPDVKLNMISYLGFPILLPDGKPFGTICVLDNQRNEYSKEIEKLMLKFRGLIEANLAIVFMNQQLGDKNKQLTDYLMELQTLRGLVSICANCKSIKDAQGNWHPIEDYLIRHPEANFSHGICPECYKNLYPEMA